MVRLRSTGAAEAEGPVERPAARPQAQEHDSSSNLHGHAKDDMPTIRLTPHQDPRSNRPSLTFPATTRTLPHEECVIRVGRYSERDVNPNPVPNQPSAAPIGFKSKVVSRRHCEFWCSQGQWYIKDVKSSSGTFLNHIRLSQPNMESRPFPVNDGDVVQLGIDFRGGEEMIFRCVKIRIECNRGWQKTLNNYKPILNDHKSWPQFLCPNCRAIHDLDADVDDSFDTNWEEEEDRPMSDSPGRSGDVEATQTIGENTVKLQNVHINGNAHERLTPSPRVTHVQEDDHFTQNATARANLTDGATTSSTLLERRNVANSEQANIRLPSGSGSFLSPIVPTQPLMSSEETLEGQHSGTPTMDMLVNEGPMTPTNTAGPFVFDGSAGRSSSEASAAA
ncbi:uncharacterized protein KY384_004842 [Bacidia gigantensis]|uniref:uncharacterized protein n=1 Tax=Bacidia gigantensis TaxID=2732470 RepID=UPI001D04D85B|nr:uncharacterized protein KY384_004842 [Bacidia gigantensis]KAG8530340.1 hypothetical protein KY384_004842 [Bacidia gigantensis]